MPVRNAAFQPRPVRISEPCAPFEKPCSDLLSLQPVDVILTHFAFRVSVPSGVHVSVHWNHGGSSKAAQRPGSPLETVSGGVWGAAWVSGIGEDPQDAVNSCHTPPPPTLRKEQQCLVLSPV